MIGPLTCEVITQRWYFLVSYFSLDNSALIRSMWESPNLLLNHPILSSLFGALLRIKFDRYIREILNRVFFEKFSRKWRQLWFLRLFSSYYYRFVVGAYTRYGVQFTYVKIKICLIMCCSFIPYNSCHHQYFHSIYLGSGKGRKTVDAITGRGDWV